MFGYIRAFTPELKMRENEYYKAAYCGLCGAYGKCVGCTSRLTLNYDFVFLSLVRMALDDGVTVEFEKKRCPVHPFKKRTVMKINTQSEYCARAAVLMCYHKCLDDLADEKGKRRLRAKLMLPAFRRMRKRAKLDLLDGVISDCLTRLSAIEKENVGSVDRPAGVFGELMRAVTSEGFSGREKAIASNIGYHIGKWIYITDALDDYNDDIKAGRYNPFKALYGGEAITDERREYIKIALTSELTEAEKAFDLIDYTDEKKTDMHGIINNIIYIGMPNTATEVSARQKKKSEITKADK